MSSIGSIESSLLTAVAVGAFAVLYFFGGKPVGELPTTEKTEAPKGGKKKNKKKGGSAGATVSDVPQPLEESVGSLPGALTKLTDSILSESDVNASGKETTTKAKKRKNKSKQPTPTPSSSKLKLTESSAPTAQPPPNPTLSASSRLLESTESLGTADEGWTRVSRSAGSGIGANRRTGTETSDKGTVTTSSVTGTEDEDIEPPKTLAEKLLPKPAKTDVDDMLEEGSQPQLARIMRVIPTAERPASGFSWGDYEDGDEVRRSTGAESDGDDGGGWSSVKTKTRRPPNTSTSTSNVQDSSNEAPSKKQRQNAAKRDARKNAKADAEAERLATLAKHKRSLEKVRMEEQFKNQGKGKANVSGGMKATIDENGKLVWE